MITKTPTYIPIKVNVFEVKKPNTYQLTNSKKFNSNLEALRGITAIFVVLHHLIGFSSYLDPYYFPGFLHSFQPHGVLRVLIFFVLSGYIIGTRYTDRFTTDSILIYLKKRFVRLYPIYAISLLITLSIASTNYSLHTLIGNFTFTQFIFSGLIEENVSIWSLQYEVLYFLLFIPISFFNINIIALFVFSIVLGLGNYLIYPYFDAPVLSSYSFGLTFWTSGLMLAKYFRKNNNNQVNYGILLSIIPLILCLHKLNIFSICFVFFNQYVLGQSIQFPETVSWFERSITFNDLSYLPYCMMFILAFAGKDFKYKKKLFGFLMMVPALTLIYLLLTMDANENNKFLVILGLYIATLIFHFSNFRWVTQLSKALLKSATWVGGISYGIFIIHFPLLVLFKKIDFFSGSIMTFCIRAIVFASITILISYILEKKFQPWIRQRLT